MGEDNFWKMGETGPCGPCSEIYFDRGESHGPPGGPALGGAERFVEIWNLVFMQYNRTEGGSLEDLPRRSIDTGAGLERILPLLQGVGSPFETDEFLPVLEAAQEVTGTRYGSDRESDVSLRILADHSRAAAMLIADGVLPSNDGRGYVLRRIIRRAVVRARRLGANRPVLGHLLSAVVPVLGRGYGNLVEDRDLIEATLEREEGQFSRTLETGSALLEEQLAAGSRRIGGDVAFLLHDRHGFPVELTSELARERGVEVDIEGFEREMSVQRERARADARARRAVGGEERVYRSLLEENGPSTFLGYERYDTPSRVVAVFESATPGEVEIVLDRTPFYAESGGQVGDTGSIVSETGRATVVDTQSPVAGLTVHRSRLEGEMFAGQEVVAVIDAERRESIRRNHTGTHLLHAALRRVLGDHVRQQGSLVAADRLRFDFSHHSAVPREELGMIAEEANSDVIADSAVSVVEASRSEAEAMGALAFFGDKYGESVRVVKAGERSTELCGGTHVERLGMIGPITILSEGSIGSNTRRIEAATGRAALAHLDEQQGLLVEASKLLRVEPAEVPGAIDRLMERERRATKEIDRLRARALQAEAVELAASARRGAVVARRDGMSSDQLRELAHAARVRGGLEAVVLGGSPDGAKVAIAASTDGSFDARMVVKRAAEVVGGGGGGSSDLAVAGGRDVTLLDKALGEAARAIGQQPGQV
jgi:alanyl-tRNA synthetase